MADSTVLDASKMKVVDLRKELKSRGLPHTGDKAELIARLQTAMAQDDHQDINLDSDEIDSDSVLEEDEKLEDDDEKSQTDILDDTGVDTINEELALADQPTPKPASEVKPMRTLKRKITADTKESKGENKEAGTKKIVLNRATSVTPVVKPDGETTQSKPEVITAPTDSKIKINADIDAKTRLEMRAKRFGLPVKISDDERKEARKQRFGHNATSNDTTSNDTTNKTPASLSENLDKLKQRAERFGQSVSKIMTEIELKERIEKRKAKFGTVK